MSSFFSNLNTLVLSYSSYFFKNKETDSLSDLFNAKFKNLLDDYISNYLVKYLFFILFISFFCFELSFNAFSLLSFKSTYIPFILDFEDSILYCINTTLSCYMIDLCTVLFSSFFFDFFYNFIAFNLDVLLSVLFGIDRAVFTMLLVLLIVCIYILEIHTHMSRTSIFTFLLVYLAASVLVYIPYMVGFFGINIASAILLSIPLLLTVLLGGISAFDTYLLSVMFIVAMLGTYASFVFPLIIVFFLFGSLFPAIRTRSLEEEINTGIDGFINMGLFFYVFSSMYSHLGDHFGPFFIFFVFLGFLSGISTSFNFFVKQD